MGKGRGGKSKSQSGSKQKAVETVVLEKVKQRPRPPPRVPRVVAVPMQIPMRPKMNYVIPKKSGLTGHKTHNKVVKNVEKKIQKALPAKGFSGNVARVLSQLMLPYEAPLTRVRPAGSGASMVETAMARNFITHELDMSAVFANSKTSPAALPRIVYPNGTSFLVWGQSESKYPVVHLNDPYVVGIVPSPNITGSTYACSSFCNPTFDSILSQFTLDSSGANTMMVHPSGILWLEPVGFLPIGGVTNSYGKTHPILDISKYRVVWIDANSANPATLNISLYKIANVVDVVQVQFVLFECPYGDDPPSPAYFVNFGAFTGNQSTATLSVKNSGYYIMGLDGFITTGNIPQNSAVSFQLSVNLVANTCIVSRHIVNYNLPTSSSVTSESLVKNVQLNGAGLLLNNPAAKMAQGGKIWAVSCQQNLPWVGYTSDADKQVVSANSSLRYDSDWERGGYGYIKPMVGFSMRPTVVTSENSATAIKSYCVDPTSATQMTRLSGMNVWLIEPPTVAAGSVQPYVPILYLKFSVAYEYTTASQMVVIGSPKVTPSEADVAINALASMINFTENSFHLPSFISAIRNKIRGIVSAVSPIARTTSHILQAIPHPSVQEVGRVLSGVTDFADSI